jgi:hypothetical protein
MEPAPTWEEVEGGEGQPGQAVGAEDVGWGERRGGRRRWTGNSQWKVYQGGEGLQAGRQPLRLLLAAPAASHPMLMCCQSVHKGLE